MRNYCNLSKLFRYVNDNGDSVTFDYAGGYLINKPVGIDTLSVSLSQAQGIDQVGATIQSKTVQPRPVTISGALFGDEQKAGKDRLLAVVRPDIGGRLYADDYYLTVHVTATPTIEPVRRGAKFQFSLRAPYPYWCKDDNVITRLSQVEPRFRFPWNLARDYRFGEVVVAAFFTVVNSGQVPVPFTATIVASGEVVNPKILSVLTGETLQIKKTLEAGERLEIRITHERTYVTSSIDGECRGALSLQSNLYRLAVGDNILKPDADSGKANMQINIDYATEIVGIAL
ncbi:phage tail family protein [bacterium]|nr:phage tail family protein [bacterium]